MVYSGVHVINYLSGRRSRDSRCLFRQSAQRRDDDRRRQSVGSVDRLVDVDVVVGLHHEVQGPVGQSSEQAEEVFHQLGQVGHVARHLQDQEQVRQ